MSTAVRPSKESTLRTAMQRYRYSCYGAFSKGAPQSSSVTRPTHRGTRFALSSCIEPLVVVTSTAWFAILSGISPSMNFSEGVDDLTAALGGGLPRPICAGIHWILCMAAPLGSLCLLLSVIPALGNRALMTAGASLMAMVVVYNVTVNSILSGCDTLQLLHSALFVLTMRVLPRVAMVSDDESGFIRWLVTTRPWSFTAVLLPLAVTAATLDWWGIEIKSVGRATEVILSMVLLQAAANQMNSLADWRSGVDKADSATSDMTVLSGLLPVKALVISSAASLATFAVVFADCARDVDEAYFAIDKWIVVIGVVLSIIYTVFPIPLKYIGLGDVVVFMCFGPLSVAHFTLSLTDPEPSFSRIGDVVLYTLPVALIVTVILSANNIRDMTEDWKAGCYTFEGILGRKGSRAYFAGLIIAAHALSVSLAVHRRCYGLLLTLLALPRSIWLIKRVCFTPETSEKFKVVDQAAAHTLLIFGLTTVLGISSVTQEAQVNFPSLLFSSLIIGLLHFVG
ncbi:UbiA prenyltransferase domain-containing protein 1 [Perkinsus olseni]|uniref:UbiA prenyltransferase domain-containing protein 1 n=1 Tax=Perkinsus olseni TaxID=32597 RepID=A0A7J6M053_PEROL|nr:UbiA prenyltransferase domain-containing protein 1 [Perkinsus olseni]